MVASPLTLVGYTAFTAMYLAGTVSSASLKTNPVTPLGVESVLVPGRHPAVGTEIKGQALAEPIIKDDPSAAYAAALEIVGISGDVGSSNNGTAPSRMLRHMEAATVGTDVETLEKHYKEAMERNFNDLKSKYGSGASKPTPWPGSYWPTYQDGINAVWKSGEPSASEKFATAFGKNVKQFQDAISARSGIQGQSGHRACQSDWNCQSLNDGSKCAIRAGQSSGFCIPTWYGICHAWAPAAQWEPEPKCAIKKNGVTFRPMDIKALLTQVYNDAYVTVVFLGARFDGPDSPLNLDKYGRFNDAARRDLGAGLFHIALTNVMGKHGQSIVLDVAPGSEVWNQPVSSYKILESRLVDAKEASRRYYGTRTYPFNTDMKNLAYTRTRVSWIVESLEDGALVSTGRVGAYTTTVEYEYLLELDDKYNIIGGEWLSSSNQNHPDFLWFATGPPDISTVTDLGMSYKDVRTLLDASIACNDIPSSPTPAPTTLAPTPAPTPTPAVAQPPSPTTPVPSTQTPPPNAPTPAPNAQTPAPNGQAPKPTTPSPTAQTPAPTAQTPKPTTPSPTAQTPAPTAQTPKPTTPSPTAQTPAPTAQTPKPTTPSPTFLTPGTPSPTTPGPKTPAPTTVAPTPAPTTPAPTTVIPGTPAPTTPAPTTVTPGTPAPTTPSPKTPAPSTVTPATPSPTTPGQTPGPKPTPAMSTPGQTPKPGQSPTPAPTGQTQTPQSTPAPTGQHYGQC